MSKSITTLLTFLSRLSSSYGNPTEPGLTRSQCSTATHGGGAVKLPVLLKLVLEDHQHEPLRLLPVLVKPRRTAQQCTDGIGGVACCPWFNTCGKIGLCTPAGAWWFAIENVGCNGISEIIQCTDFLMHESHISRPI